jgi:hypothetical protein
LLLLVLSLGSAATSTSATKAGKLIADILQTVDTVGHKQHKATL